MIKIYNNNSLDIFYKIINQYHNKNIILVSDPPFNMNYKYETYDDNLDEDEYYEMLDFFFHDLPSVVIHYPEELYKLSFQIGKFPSKVISWVYNSNTAKQHRDIAFFDIKPDMSKVKQPYKNLNDKRIIERIENGEVGANLYDWWEINQVKNVNEEKTEHPCQMPLEVMKRIIGILPDNCLIIDPFMGSGTTGLAVIEMNNEQNKKRDFIGIELDKKYYKIALNRLRGSKPNGQLRMLFNDKENEVMEGNIK